MKDDTRTFVFFLAYMVLGTGLLALIPYAAGVPIIYPAIGVIAGVLITTLIVRFVK